MQRVCVCDCVTRPREGPLHRQKTGERRGGPAACRCTPPRVGCCRSLLPVETYECLNNETTSRTWNTVPCRVVTRGEGTRIEDPSHQDRAGRGHTSLNPISSQSLTVFFIYYCKILYLFMEHCSEHRAYWPVHVSRVRRAASKAHPQRVRALY